MRALLHALFPPKCVLCRAPLTEREDTALCPDCARQVRQRYRVTEGTRVTGTDGAAAALRYTGAVRNAMHRYKFRHFKGYYLWFAAHAAAALAERLSDWRPDLLTYVPLGFWRRHTRGYNQSELIARRVSAILGVPCMATLRKRPFAKRQSARTAADRRENARRGFLAKAGVSLAGRRVVLLDDVLTTGATLESCAICLKSMGAEHVYVLAVTKTDPKVRQ